jgi:hypothetical protein
MSASQRVEVISRVMAWVATSGLAIFPVCVIYTFLDPQHSQWLIFEVHHLGAELSDAVPLPFRMLALACAAVPATFTLWALWSLRRLFVLYAEGEVFSPRSFAALNDIALALLGSVVAGFIMQAPISLALTWWRGNGHREISLGFGSNDISTLFLAATALVIARVMAEAGRIADENAKFV